MRNHTTGHTCLALLLLAALSLLPVCNADTDLLEDALASILGPQHLAVVINDADPASKAIGEYYIAKRGIPVANVIHVNFKPGNNNMSPRDFKKLKVSVAGR